MSRNKGLRKLKKALERRNVKELTKIREHYQSRLNLLEDDGDAWEMDKYVVVMRKFCSQILRDIDRVLDD